MEKSDIVFLAVKPQFVQPVLKEVREHLTDKHTVVSIAAGKTLSSLLVRPATCVCRTAGSAPAVCKEPADASRPAPGGRRGRQARRARDAKHALLGRRDRERHVPGGARH